MPVFSRHSTATDAETDEPDAAAATDTTTTDATSTVDTPARRRTFFPGWRRTATDADGRPIEDLSPASTAEPVVTEPAVTEPVAPVTRETPAVETRPVETRSEIRVEMWSWADALVAVIGAGLTLFGLVVLARTGINRTWYRPVVHVLDANHTAALGAAEVGAGALLILAGVARSRAAAAILGLAIAVAGALAAIENDQVRHELAIEKWWAWLLAGVGLLVAVVALAPPRRTRVERVLETR